MDDILKYVVRRLLILIPTLIGASILVFLMIHFLPGDPAQLLAGPEATLEDIERVRERLGLDKPLVVQYVMFMSRILRGDLGESLITGHPISTLIWPRFFNTLKLATLGTLIAIGVGIGVGVAAAVKRNTFIDRLAMTLAILGISTPVFLLAIILIEVFSIKLRLLPTTTLGGEPELKHLILPSLTLGLIGAASIARMTRASMLEVLHQEYIRTAYAYGFESRKILFKYALRNALIPVVTVGGLIFGYLLAGAVITETVFAYPGLGRLIVESIFARDYTVVQVGLLFTSFVFAVVNTVVDVAYAVINPKVRLR